jgi:hypothetical protein
MIGTQDRVCNWSTSNSRLIEFCKFSDSRVTLGYIMWTGRVGLFGLSHARNIMPFKREWSNQQLLGNKLTD